MPTCNRCGNYFDVDENPGAILLGHPKTVKRVCPVDKYHICQRCEKEILNDFKFK